MKIPKVLAGIVPMSVALALASGLTPVANADDPLPAPNNGRPAVDASSFPTANLKMVDDQALPVTQSLFAYLRNIGASGRSLFGHEQDTTQGVVTSASNAAEGTWDGVRSDVRRATGAYPGVIGLDINQTAQARAAYATGAIITLCEHHNNLANGTGANGSGGYGNTKNPLNSVEMILPGGPKHGNLTAYLDNVANYASQLTDSDGNLFPAIYRPWHEHNGDWFWWNTSNASEGEIAELFRFTVHYLRDVKGVHNLLYAFSPNGHFENEAEYLYGYPGDEYVDVLGFDTYFDVPVNNPDWYAQALKDMQIAVTYAERTGKIAAMTETGVRYDAGSHGFHVTAHDRYPLDWWTQMGNMIRNDPITSKLAYWLVWVNYSTTQFWVPFKDHRTYGNHPMLGDFINMYNMDSMVFADRVGDYSGLLPETADNTVKLAPNVTIHTPEFKDRAAGTRTVYVEANARVAPCAYAFSGTCEGDPGRRVDAFEVTVTLGGQTVNAVKQSGTNGWWTAEIDTTAVPDGRRAITASVVYNSVVNGKIYGAQVENTHEVFIENAPVPVNADPYLIDDFESYDSTDDNRTDLERVWWRDSDVMNGLRLRNSNLAFYPDPDHWLNKAWSDRSLDTGKVLRVKYDVVDKNSAADRTSMFTKTYPAPYRDWSGAQSFSATVQPDGKEHFLKFRITTGTGAQNTFDCDFSTTGVQWGYDPTLVAPQRIAVPIDCFKSAAAGNPSPTPAQLAGVRTTSVRITLNPEKGYLGGLNALEYYLFDDLKVSAGPAGTAANAQVLQIAVGPYQLFEDQASRYTPASFEPMAAALAYARAAIATGAVSEGVLARAIAGLAAAVPLLVEAVDRSVLEAQIAAVEAILADPSAWVSANLPALAAALAAAKALFEDPDLTQEAATAGAIALTVAKASVLPKGDKAGIIALIGLSEGLDSAKFTPASWSALEQALAGAREVRANPEASSDQVDAASTALTAALSNLVLRAAKAGLKSAIDVAASITANAAAYVPASLAGLAEALAAANAVHADDNASSAQVTSAQTALIAQIAVVRLRISAPGAAALAAGLLAPEAAAKAAADPGAVQAQVEAAVAADAKAAFAKTARPKIKGVKAVGSKLRAKAGAWSPRPTLAYQWYRGGKEIANATKAVYKLRPADRGKRISVKVTAVRAGYAAESKASAKTKRIK
ncbi:MAG: hypothetical protein LBT54_03335 [Bifidobacteriaceae bacterium]|jgi:hypothetical protein|nr:hypothetical protein [Bifidobacteriaceae bacterium]